MINYVCPYFTENYPVCSLYNKNTYLYEARGVISKKTSTTILNVCHYAYVNVNRMLCLPSPLLLSVFSAERVLRLLSSANPFAFTLTLLLISMYVCLLLLMCTCVGWRFHIATRVYIYGVHNHIDYLCMAYSALYVIWYEMFLSGWN